MVSKPELDIRELLSPCWFINWFDVSLNGFQRNLRFRAKAPRKENRKAQRVEWFSLRLMSFLS
jgi:hypothetical protein